jgi:hypothetical protein
MRLVRASSAMASQKPRPGAIGGRHGEELLFEMGDVDGHGMAVLGTG